MSKLYIPFISECAYFFKIKKPFTDIEEAHDCRLMGQLSRSLYVVSSVPFLSICFLLVLQVSFHQ